MEARILAYRKYMDELLQHEEEDWEAIRSQHLVQISFFQHERLVHLIVTVTFAFLEVIAMCALLFVAQSGGSGVLSLFALVVVLLVLLIPYIRHYYILENETQKMYRQYDVLNRKCGLKNGFGGMA